MSRIAHLIFEHFGAHSPRQRQAVVINLLLFAAALAILYVVMSHTIPDGPAAWPEE